MTTATIETQTFDFISELIRKKSAIVLEKSKGYLVESRLAPVAREFGFDNLEVLVAELRKPTSHALVQKVVDAMTTNETSFFRDLHPFQALKSTILPDLIEKRGRQRTLNIWSNACSSGQEPYTLAMSIKEHFPELASWRVKLIGSDLSSKILARAMEGVFTQTEVNRGLPMQFLLKYFVKDGIQWRIADDLRKMIEFKPLNLIEPFPSSLPKMDVVFLRNVLIYFSPETKTAILNKVHATLAPDGYLFLGGAETTMNLSVRFEKQLIGSAVCYRPV
jgi:chemotaxis protein methyltransferase CheR